MRRLLCLPAFALALSVAACSAATDDEPPPPDLPGASAGGENGGVTIGPDGLPVGPDGKPLPVQLDGLYELSSTFDLTTAGVFPDVANDTLSALSNFREHPSQTMVDLLDAANVPVVSDVLGVIPSLIRDYVLGWVDDHIIKSLYEKVPFAKTMTGMLDDLASIATQFELVTKLDLPPVNEVGHSTAVHTVAGVGYHWDGTRHVIAAPDVLQEMEEQHLDANAVTLERLSPDLESGRLTLGEHGFDLPIGSFAVLAMDKLAQDKFGAADFRDAVGKVINCAALAKDVAKRCIDPAGPGKVCVGHESDIKNMCTVGLDVLVGVIKGQILRLDLPALELKTGSAQMWDAPTEGGPLDATIDRIADGYWTAQVPLGGGDKTILASFVGHRLGDSAYGTTR